MSDKFVDMTGCFESVLEYKYASFENCIGTKASTFLKCLACYLDESINSKDIFKNLNVGASRTFNQSVNAYCVLWFDFSDFTANNFEEALDYLRNKMSMTYKHFYKYFELEVDNYYDYDILEYALDIIEKKISIDDLHHSLIRLVCQIKKQIYKRKDFKLAILVDNLVSLEVASEKDGYSEDMIDLLKRFIIEDIYKYCDIFIQIGDYKEKQDSMFFRRRYIAYQYWSATSYDLRERLPEIAFVGNVLSLCMPINYVLEKCDWSTRIEEARNKIENAKAKEERSRHEKMQKEKKKYAEDILPEIPRYSDNLGLRQKFLNKRNNIYIELTSLLKGIYQSTYPKFDTSEIYRLLMRLNERELIVDNIKKFEAQLVNLAEGNSNWQTTNVNTSAGHWVQVTYYSTHKDQCLSPGKPENIKVYACFYTYDIQDVFMESLKYLISHAGDTFAAKIATYNRSDQMCYWLSPKDFKYLEKYYAQYSDKMTRSMPFIAYRGKLGISKEFPGADNSHNSTQAHIIADYLKHISVFDEVDLESMYNNYIAKWNADIYEINDYGSFKKSSALSLIVILDSLDVILGETQINELSFILSGNSKFWQILSRSNCWADVNRFYTQESL